MGIRVRFLRELLLVGFRMDDIFIVDTMLHGLHVYILFGVPDVGVGNKEAQKLQKGVRRQVPEEEEGNVPIHHLK